MCVTRPYNNIIINHKRYNIINIILWCHSGTRQPETQCERRKYFWNLKPTANNVFKNMWRGRASRLRLAVVTSTLFFGLHACAIFYVLFMILHVRKVRRNSPKYWKAWTSRPLNTNNNRSNASDGFFRLFFWLLPEYKRRIK